jgi:hypothetical protein
MSSDLKKHIGRIRSTEQRCVVVFMQIPGKEDHALVINTESLPPRYEQSLMTILESQEAQTVQDLGNVLSRRVMPDTGVDVLNTFHQAQLLRSEPVDNIIMLPRPNMPFPLRQILESMGKTVAPPSPEMQALGEPVKYNPYLNNYGAMKAEQALGIAKNTLIEAEMLESEAMRKREQAYALAPELRPAARQAVPEPTPTPKETLVEMFRQDLIKADTEVNDEAPKRKGPGRPRKTPV